MNIGLFAEFDGLQEQLFALLVGDSLAFDYRLSGRGSRFFSQRSSAVALSQGQFPGLPVSNGLSFTNLNADLSAIGLGYPGLTRRFLSDSARALSLVACDDALLPRHGFGPRALFFPHLRPLLRTLPSTLTCLLPF